MTTRLKILERFSKLISLYSSMLSKRDENLFVFGSWWGNKFADNPKYLYLYCIRHNLNAVWITKNQEVYKQLSECDLPVQMADSPEGRESCRRAKYVFYCTSVGDVGHYDIGGATLINLWHGLPLKKIMYDDIYNKKDKRLFNRFAKWVVSYAYANDYVVSSSEEISKIYRSAFRKPDKRILQLGQPRNDCFFDGSLSKRRYSTISYKRLVAYLPTHRDEGRIPFGLSNVLDLEKLDNWCSHHDVLFLVKLHYYHRNERTDLSGYSNIIDATDCNLDTQELLYNADLLVTDYSSCYVDYLLLNRPVIFYCFDLERYLARDRQMYFPYDDVTPGPKAATIDELLSALDQCLEDDNPYGDRLMAVRDLFYASDCQGAVSERVIDCVTSLG